MKHQREYRGLTRRTRELLASSETENVDFKRDPAGVKSSDFVAFANAPAGGTLLIGVDEYTSRDGIQRGRICGCEVDDNSRLMLLNKALECTPNIDVQIYIENLARKPIMRVEVPVSDRRPFCTPRGEYSIRADGRNRALYPDELLSVFLDREGDRFIGRFRNAVLALEHQVGEVNHTLSGELASVCDHLHQLDAGLQTAFSRIGSLTDSSKKRSRNLLNTLRDSQVSLENLERLLVDEELSLDAQVRLDAIERKLDVIVNRLHKEDAAAER